MFTGNYNNKFTTKSNIDSLYHKFAFMIYECTNPKQKQILLKSLNRVNNQTNIPTKAFSP